LTALFVNVVGWIMALWKDNNSTGTTSVPPPPATRDAFSQPERTNVAPLNPPDTSRRPATTTQARGEMKESVIAADLTIEGKIAGSGHVRIAGRFKGDVHCEGNLTIDAGAHLDGQVRAAVVIVGGQLNGNIENARKVELLETGVINGDVKAGSLAVAAGSRMRGNVEFGWDDEKKSASETKGFGTAT
jgi:cytoskeletal protein CcmA (bactofilin family)